jgi:RNA polymerase sigma factor (sigma-70 family)
MSAFLDSELPPDAVQRAQAGDVAACETIYRTFERPVRTLAARLLARRHTAEDLAQDVFVEVLGNLGKYDGRGSFAGWIRAIAVNRCLMHLRSPWQRSLRWLESSDVPDTDDFDRHASTVAAGEHIDLERALGRLGDTARCVVWLHDVEGYTHAEIGALLGGTASFSKSQLARAHARLRQLLEPDGVGTTCMPASSNC